MATRREQWHALEISSGFLLLLCLVTLWQQFFGYRLLYLGIEPRSWIGLRGVLFCPLLHAGVGHLLANALPLWILMILLFSNRRYHPGPVFAWLWLGSGFGTWLIGRPTGIHVGASALIFGLVTYLITAGFWMRSWKAVGTALLVFLAFGGIFYGLLHNPPGVSWEGHLSGAVTGLVCAWNFQRS